MSAFRIAAIVLLVARSGVAVAGVSPGVAVTAGSGKNAERAAQLVEAAVSAREDVRLVDRAAVAAAAREKGLGDAGLVAAEDAIALRAAVSADVFLAVDAGESSARLVAFDAVRGVRLHDATWPLDQVEAAAPQAIAAALAKRSGGDGRKTVSVVRLRNADLPSTWDPHLATVAMLVERRLAAGRQVSVLERAHLGDVNRERQIPTAAAPPPATSLVTLDLELRRAGKPDEAIVTAVWTKPGGESGRIEAAADLRDAARTADALADGLLRALAAAPSGMPRDHTEEARALAAESTVLRHLRRFDAALALAEAAAALEDSRPHRRLLAHALVDAAEAMLAGPNHTNRHFPPTLPEASEYALRAMDMLQRSLELWSLALADLEAEPTYERLRSAMYEWHRHRDDALLVLGRLNALDVQHTVTGIEHARSRTAELRLRHMRLWDGHVGHPKHSFERIVSGYESQLVALQLTVDSAAAYAPVAEAEVRRCLELIARLEPAAQSESERRQLQTFELNGVCMLALRPRSAYVQDAIRSFSLHHWRGAPHPDPRATHALAEHMATQAHPVVSGYGRLGRILALTAEGPARDKVGREFDALVSHLDTRLSDPSPWPRETLRGQLLHLWKDAIEAVFDHAPEERRQRSVELWEAMLEHKAVVGTLVTIGYEEGAYPSFGLDVGDRRTDLLRRTDTLMRDPELHVYSATRDDFERRVTASVHGGAGRPDAAPSPFVRPQRLFDAAAMTGFFGFGRREVLGDHMLLVARLDVRHSAPGRVAVVDLSLRDGTTQTFGPIELDWGDVPELPTEGSYNVALAAHDRWLALGTRRHGVFLIDRQSREVHRLTAESGGLPSDHVVSLAWLGDTLYIGCGDTTGYLVAVAVGSAPPTFATPRVLVASGRLNAATPLDRMANLDIRGLWPSVDRRRLFVLAQNRRAHDAASGVYALDTSTTEIIQLARLDLAHPLQSPVFDQGVLIGDNPITVRLDLVDGSLRLIRGPEHVDAAAHARALPSHLIETPAPVRGYWFRRGGVVWRDHLWFSATERVSLANGRHENLARMSTPGPATGYEAELAHIDEQGRVIIIQGPLAWRAEEARENISSAP